MARCFRPFYINCSGCGRRNRPHSSPRQGLRLVLLGEFANCRHCGKTLTVGLTDRPLLRQVLADLQREQRQVAPTVRLPDGLPDDLLGRAPSNQAA